MKYSFALWTALILLCASCASAAEATPSLFLLSAKTLERTREQAAAPNSPFGPALAKLKREANGALKVGPLTVMNKTRVPPSGDKHDYLSLAPYFWPDPAKADGLPYIRRDGHRNPEAQEGTDRPALGKLMSAVDSLALAYYFTRHEPYAEHAAKLVRTWFLDEATRMNPHLEYAQGITGVNNGRGIGIIEMAQFGDLCEDLELLAGSPAWTKEDGTRFRAWLKDYFRWLLTSRNGLDEAGEPNNHGTWYDVQTAHLALILGEHSVARRILAEGRTKRLEAQLEPDGSQPRELARTRSLNYSMMNLDGLFRLARLAEAVEVDWWQHEGPEGRGLKRALNFLAPYADESKPWLKEDVTQDDRGRLFMLLAKGQSQWNDPAQGALLKQHGSTEPHRSAKWRLELGVAP